MALKETELYSPVKELLLQLGYQVKGEVNHVDVLGIKDDQIVIVELKTSLNLKLLIQGVKRQRLTDNVYIAIPMPKYKKRFSKDAKDREYLIRRLELGLIYVSTNSKKSYAQIVFDPKPFSLEQSQRQSKRRLKALIDEAEKRSGDHNTGGTNGKLITSYREKSLKIALVLSGENNLTPKTMRELGCDEKTTLILNKNYYGWFIRESRGHYSLSDTGREALKDYQEVLEHL